MSIQAPFILSSFWLLRALTGDYCLQLGCGREFFFSFLFNKMNWSDYKVSNLGVP